MQKAYGWPTRATHLVIFQIGERVQIKMAFYLQKIPCLQNYHPKDFLYKYTLNLVP